MTIQKPIILSLDGGGVRGYASARILHEIEQRLRNKLNGNSKEFHFGRAFDLVVGTSTGAILAAACAACDAEGIPLVRISETLDLYRNISPRIFQNDLATSARSIFMHKFSHRLLKDQLSVYCGSANFGQVVTNLAIPAFDAENGQTRMFRSGPAWHRNADSRLQLVDVLTAAAAAPIYFDAPTVFFKGTSRMQNLIDAAVVLNNPALRALSEAERLFPRRRSSSILISIGTEQSGWGNVKPESKKWGLLQWLNPAKRVPILQLLMSAQSSEVHDHVSHLLWDNSNYFRFEPDYEGAPPAIDDASTQALETMDMALDRFKLRHEHELDRLAEMIAARQRSASADTQGANRI